MVTLEANTRYVVAASTHREGISQKENYKPIHPERGLAVTMSDKLQLEKLVFQPIKKMFESNGRRTAKSTLELFARQLVLMTQGSSS